MIVVFMFEFVVVVLILAILITQIIFPFMRGTPIFPIFRKEAVLSAKLEDVKQQVVEKDLTDQITKTKKHLK
jgi:hypothetical protein